MIDEKKIIERLKSRIDSYINESHSHVVFFLLTREIGDISMNFVVDEISRFAIQFFVFSVNFQRVLFRTDCQLDGEFV